MKGVQTKEEIEALRKAYGYEYSVPELEAIVYQQHVLNLRFRHRAERHARLAAMAPLERLATELRNDVVYIMSPGTDITCGRDANPTFETLENWHRLDMSGLAEDTAIWICGHTARKLLQEGWLRWDSARWVLVRTNKVEEPWE
jgi:hypothetical protein